MRKRVGPQCPYEVRRDHLLRRSLRTASFQLYGDERRLCGVPTERDEDGVRQGSRPTVQLFEDSTRPYLGRPSPRPEAMSSSPNETIAYLLEAAQRGEAEAQDQLYARLYDELRRLARVVRKGGETLNTTALVHEAYLRLEQSEDLAVNDRTHFFRLAARAMRHVVCDMARHRSAQKRGGGAFAVTLDERVQAPVVDPADLIALDDALAELARRNERHAEVVECRFFAGLTVEETAEALGVSVPTVVRDWRFAQAWLAKVLESGPSEADR